MSENLKSSNQKHWINAYHLFLAEKALDSLLFIRDNALFLKNTDLHTLAEEKRRTFYIELRNVYNVAYKDKRRHLLKEDVIASETLYESDKRYAHSDMNYQNKETEMTWDTEIEKLKFRMNHCFNKCIEVLPENFTVFPIPYDKEKFRLLNGITPNKEEEFKKAIHPLYGKSQRNVTGKTYSVFNYIEEIPSIDNPDNYAVILEEGLTLFEGLQNRQEWAIKANILYDQKIWVSPIWKTEEEAKEQENESVKLLLQILEQK
jgi:hypothetical protein